MLIIVEPRFLVNQLASDMVTLLQALEVEDKAVECSLGAMMAWTAEQETIADKEFKKQCSRLSEDSSFEKAIAKEACNTWSQATAALNKVSSS